MTKATTAVKATNKKAVAVKEEVKVTTVEIPVTAITSGKMELSIFNFTFNKKRIVTPFFPVIVGKPEYDYDHHVDAERLDVLNEKYPTFEGKFFSYGNRAQHEEYRDITIASYGELMKYNLCKLLMSGLVNVLNGNTQYAMKWNGEALAEPQLKSVVVKEKKEKVNKAELDGLNFFN